jgi:hypothetical protein
VPFRWRFSGRGWSYKTNRPEEAPQMLSTKIRTTAIALIAACGIAIATIAPAVSQATKNNYGYQKTVGKRRQWLNTCANAQISYTNWTEFSRWEFIKGETAYSGQDKEVAEKIKENANASGCSIK